MIYCALQIAATDYARECVEQCKACQRAYKLGFDWYNEISVKPNYPVPAKLNFMFNPVERYREILLSIRINPLTVREFELF